MAVKTEVFGSANGKGIRRFVITTDAGAAVPMEVRLIELGATIQGIRVKAKDGRWIETVLHYSGVEAYLAGKSYFGAVCGRNANRISEAEVSIDGNRYSLEKNEGENNLHSGAEGFHFCIFEGKATGENEVTFIYLSPEMEQGFPGTMSVKVIYSLSSDGELQITYKMLADKDTICNLTNHAYFNLNGEGTVLDHELQVAADFYTPVDDALLPTGEILSVKETAFDLTVPVRLGSRFGEADEVLPGGYDHNFVLNKKTATAADIYSPETGIGIRVSTSLPGVQIYAGGGLNNKDISDGKAVPQFGGVCMETQYFPDSLAHAHFPQPIQKAGTMKVETTVFAYYYAK